jgi:microcystin degradation protein MlrC
VRVIPRFAPLGRGGRPLRIGYGRIFHEGCAASPLRTTQADFERTHHLEGAALAHAASLRGDELKSFFPHAELTGFIQAARFAGDVTAVPLSSSLAVPSGPVTRACFDWLLERLLGAIRGAGDLDGVYLALHGSMEVEGLGEAPEAVILRAVRAALGPGPRLAASFDLHGNLSRDVVDALDVLVAYRTNPHWDLAPTGYRAGNQLIRTLRGQLKPTHAWRKLPVVLGGGTTIDFLQPLRAVFREMKRLHRDPRVEATSFFVVHPFTSRPDLGWALHVTTNDDAALAERLADALADLAWRASRTPLPPMLDVDAALDVVERSAWRRLGPVTLVDADDIVGAGAPGGSTQVLAALAARDRGLRALIPIHDPALFDEAWALELGAEREVEVRGTPGYAQPPVRLRARVAAKADTELGRRVRLEAGPIQLAISADPPLPIHPRYWRELGVSPRGADLMVQKNFFHYRLFHWSTSFQHVPVISSGATSLRHAAERVLPVPSAPRVALEDWRAGDRAHRGLEPTAASVG